MNALNNMKIGVKLIASFIFLAIIAGAVGVVGIVNIRTIDANDTKLYENYTVPIELLGQMTDHFQQMRVSMRDALLSTDAQQMEGYLGEIDAQRTELDKLSAEFEALILSDQMRQAYNNFVTTRDVYRPQQQKVIALIRAGKKDEAVILMRGDALKDANAEQAAITRLMDLKVADAKTTEDANTATAATAVTTVVVVVVAAMLIALTLGIVLSNSITGPLQKGVVMMQEMSLGHLSNRLNMERQDEIGTLARAMDQFSDDLRNIVVSAMKKIAAGDLTVEILKKDERDEISPALQGTLQALNGLIAEMTNMSTQQDAGDLDVKIDVNRFQGAYRTMAQGVNEMVFGHIAVKRKAMACVAEFGRGNFEAPLEKFPGKKAFINETIEEVRSNLKTLSAETGMLSKAAVEGRLSTRANVGAFKGDWAALVKGMNDTLDAVIGPLNVAAAYVDKIAGGVVPPLITETYHGDFNTLKNNLNRMSDRLREMLTGISDAANNLSSATAEILAATTQQASGASEQSAAISQTTTTVEEVKASAEQASMRAQDVATASQRTVEVARSGQTSVQATIESMGVIKERVEGISENLLALSDQTQQIGEIIAKVNEIASQSNMLALNASVEAARAGEHGKGFAVVATEVRSLAEQSRQATEQIKAILSEIQKATNSTVMATEEGVKGVDRGVQLSAQSRESIEQLAAVINESAQVAAQVVASGQQQQTGIDQIALAMQNINQVTMQSLASTRQTEKSAQNLNELARKMSEILAQYRF